jgi:putative phosphoribosyl transferase
MYFASRSHAGALLAEELKNYRYENSVVISLTDGGVLVGEQIASEIHAVLSMLVIEEIILPGEDMTIGTVDHTGGFAYNSKMSQTEIDDYYAEYHGNIDQQRRETFQRLNRLLVDGGLVDKELVRDHTVILVSDGLKCTH